MPKVKNLVLKNLDIASSTIFCITLLKLRHFQTVMDLVDLSTVISRLSALDSVSITLNLKKV